MRDARVGGDWYDAFELPDGRMGLSIGDVTGHGLAASLAVGKLRQAIFTLARRLDDPAEILAEVNAILREQEPETFATALVAFIAPDGSTLCYATAGHPPPIVAYAAATPATVFATDGPPLGVKGALALSTHAIPIVEDMVLLFYTDGAIEYSRDAIAGEKKLQAVTATLVGKTNVARPAQFIYESVLGDIPPHDGVALLLLQFSPLKSFENDRPADLNKEWRFHASDARAAHVARREMAEHIFATCGATEAAHTSELTSASCLPIPSRMLLGSSTSSWIGRANISSSSCVTAAPV